MARNSRGSLFGFFLLMPSWAILLPTKQFSDEQEGVLSVLHGSKIVNPPFANISELSDNRTVAKSDFKAEADSHPIVFQGPAAEEGLKATRIEVRFSAVTATNGTQADATNVTAPEKHAKDLLSSTSRKLVAVSTMATVGSKNVSNASQSELLHVMHDRFSKAKDWASEALQPEKISEGVKFLRRELADAIHESNNKPHVLFHTSAQILVIGLVVTVIFLSSCQRKPQKKKLPLSKGLDELLPFVPVEIDDYESGHDRGNGSISNKRRDFNEGLEL